MIAFPYTRTRRVAVRLVELALGEAIAICKLPGERHEATATHLLRAIAKGAERPIADRYITDPRLWTVEERTLLIATYLAHVATDGPDFAIGSARLSDYVAFDKDSTQDQTDLCEVAGKARVMRPLLGLHAEALETLCKSRGEWVIGAVACQIFEKAEPAPDWANMSDVDAMSWVQARMEALQALPESAFEELWLAYAQGAQALEHFFIVNFDDQGIVYDARSSGEEGAGYSPARFPAISCPSKLAQALAGRAD